MKYLVVLLGCITIALSANAKSSAKSLALSPKMVIVTQANAGEITSELRSKGYRKEAKRIEKHYQKQSKQQGYTYDDSRNRNNGFRVAGEIVAFIFIEIIFEALVYSIEGIAYCIC